MMELLAPAGNMSALDACVKAGADAVYLGLDALNARRGAANFAPDELARAAEKLHGRDMKLYVTVNTLVKDSEFGVLDTVVNALSDTGADAAIVQDIGVAAYLKEALPSLALHASTQMAIHNYQGVRWLKKMGFQRAILARETTLGDIRSCAAQGVDIEAFGHGALCVSCSGQCLMSSLVGGRSGNRGMCAQPCRLGYSLGARSGDLISPKDLLTLNDIAALEGAGVKSLKLEGRLKSPDYVYAVVSAYRRALDGEKPDPEALKHVFNRGYTRGYYFGADDADIVSDPTAEHVLPGSLEYAPREKKIAIDAQAVVKIGRPLSMTATDGENEAWASGETVERALNSRLDREDVSRQLLKTGGTPFEIRNFSCEIDPGAFVRVSSLNALRRDCLDALNAARVEKNRGCGRDARPVSPVDIPDAPMDRPLLSVESARVELLEIARECGADELVYAPKDVTRLPASVEADALVLPPTLPGGDLDKLNEWALKQGFKATLLSNPAHLAMDWPGETRIDWPMNVFNSRAVKVLNMGYCPSIELTAGEIARLPGAKELIVYGRATLMRLRMCPLHAIRAKGRHALCGACGDKLFLDDKLCDRKNAAFPLMRLKTGAGCVISVLNSVPLMLLRRAAKLPKAGRWRMILTDENEKMARILISAHVSAVAGRPIDDYDVIDEMKTTTGHYFRGVD